MSIAPVSTRPFEPGTTGWTADDLNDPHIAELWESGAYEIVEGVLATMPPAYADGTLPLQRLVRQIERHLDRTGQPGEFGGESDLVLGRSRVARVDQVLFMPEYLERQRQENARRGRPGLDLGRLLLPPPMVIESISPGHERHDEQTKKQWYAEFGIPQYWLLNAYRRTLVCLVLEGGAYRIDVSGSGDDTISPSLFPGLTISLHALWSV